MKGKAIARRGFCDVYQEDNRTGFNRPQVSIDWRKQSANASVLRARSTRLLSQETAKSRILILVGLSTVRQFCQNLGVALT
jgi:hypothetical protein